MSEADSRSVSEPAGRAPQPLAPQQSRPFERIRRTTARRLTESVTQKPHVTLHRRCSIDLLQRRRREAGSGLLAALLKAVAVAVGRSGRLNGIVEDGVLTFGGPVHLGVAVDVDGALVVPVVRDADQLSVSEIEATVRELAEKARSRKLRIEDVTGATFTVSSLGALGVDYFTPIISPPQLAILGVGAIEETVRLRGGGVEPAFMISLSLSFDHAATDGADAARVLAEIAAEIEAGESPSLQRASA